MFRLLASVFSFFVLLFVVSCPSPKKKGNPKIVINDASKNFVNNKPKSMEKGAAPETPAPSNTTPQAVVQVQVPVVAPGAPGAVREGAVIPQALKDKLRKENRELNGNKDGNLKFEPSDQVLEYLKGKISDPLSKLNFINFENRDTVEKVSKNVGDGNDENGRPYSKLSYSVKTGTVNRKGHLVHKYDYEYSDEVDDEKVKISLDSVKSNGNVKVVGRVNVENNGITLTVVFGDVNRGQMGHVSKNQYEIGKGNVNDCQDDENDPLKKGSDNYCYNNPVEFNNNNEAISGRFSILLNHHESKKYDISDNDNNKNGKEILKKLGFSVKEAN